MVCDKAENAGRYGGATAFIPKGIAAARRHADAPPGRYAVPGAAEDDMYLLVQQYGTRAAADGVWETHRDYIDIQLVVNGRERIGFADRDALTVTAPYDAKIDAELYAGEGAFIECGGGDFMVFWPGEAHMPCMSMGESAPVKKIVVKVRAKAVADELH